MRGWYDALYLVRLTIRRNLFWLTAVAAVPAVYWLCLRFLFPGYFAPLSAFHPDFYDYAAAGVKPFSILFTRYPRPASFAVAKILANAGFRVLLIGGIAIALAGVVATFAFARVVFGLWSPRVLAALVLYLVLLFAHPQFYIVHRHDLAAEAAYLFLILSLLAWASFISRRAALSSSAKFTLVSAAIVLAALSVFSKETYFASALCLLAGLALANPRDRRMHAVFLLVLLALDYCSFAWNRHTGWPPVDLSPTNVYKMSLAPRDLFTTYYFYLSRMFNPALILVPLVGIAAVWRDRKTVILGIAFLAAGLAALAPHAILPNHLDSEYAWLGVALYLAPLLLLGRPNQRAHAILAAATAGVLALLAVFGPHGYRHDYRTGEARWLVEEDRKGAAVVESLARLQALARPARVLVTGLEDSAIPWETGDFVHAEFGDQILWSVVLPEANNYRRSSRLVSFPHAAELHLDDFDSIVRYNSSGKLIDIRPVATIPKSESRAEVIVPALELLSAASGYHQPDAGLLINSARLCLEWGLWADAERLLDEAIRAGASGPQTTELARSIHAATAKRLEGAHAATLTARPEHVIQPDGSGLGAVDLFWTVPEGLACEVHINAPDGSLFASSSGSGHAYSQKWVKDGMRFFLQDVSGGKPLTAGNTLAQVTVQVTR